MNGLAPIMRPLEAIDAVRGHVLARIGPLAPRLLRDRDWRVAVYGIASILIALLLTFTAPMILLAIGPLVLGVPHLAADVRYLVVRPGLHRRLDAWLFIFFPAALSFVQPHAWVSMFACVGAAVISRTSFMRRALVALVALAVVVLCAELGRVADLVLAHAHNAIAVGLFVLWYRRKSRLHLAVALAFVFGLAAIGLGLFDGAGPRLMSSTTLVDPEELLASLAPLADQGLAMRLLLTFAFAQSVHYAVWVRLVPEEDRPRPGLRSFTSSLRALRSDFGLLGLVVFGVCAFGIMGWGVISFLQGAPHPIVDAREGYLRLAVFHGPLELGAATLLLLERGTLGTLVGRLASPDSLKSQPEPSALVARDAGKER